MTKSNDDFKNLVVSFERQLISSLSASTTEHKKVIVHLLSVFV